MPHVTIQDSLHPAPSQKGCEAGSRHLERPFPSLRVVSAGLSAVEAGIQGGAGCGASGPVENGLTVRSTHKVPLPFLLAVPRGL